MSSGGPSTFSLSEFLKKESEVAPKRSFILKDEQPYLE